MERVYIGVTGSCESHRVIKHQESSVRKYALFAYDSNSKSKKSKAVRLHVMAAHGGERRYSSYSFLTSAIEGVSG
jgi:hypothetical protein